MYPPRRAVGPQAFSTTPSSGISAPITGVPTARLNVRFRAGSAAGDYALSTAYAGW